MPCVHCIALFMLSKLICRLILASGVLPLIGCDRRILGDQGDQGKKKSSKNKVNNSIIVVITD